MNYLSLSLISMVSLGVYYFVVKIISVHVPSPVILLIGTIVLISLAFVYLYFTKTPLIPKRKIYMVYTFLVSIPLIIALLAFYLAIARGPVSVVMPIYALNATVTAFLGILVFREKTSLIRGLGLLLAIAAIVLLSR